MCKSTPPYRFQNKLTPQEVSSLNNLTKNTSIIIKSADKGGSIVIQNQDTYLNEAHRLLSDTNTYTRLHGDPLPQFSIEAKLLVKQALNYNIISKAEASFLSREYYNTPYFYHLPKDSHNPLGRPLELQ